MGEADCYAPVATQFDFRERHALAGTSGYRLGGNDGGLKHPSALPTSSDTTGTNAFGEGRDYRVPPEVAQSRLRGL